MVIKLTELPEGVRYIVAGSNVAVNAALSKPELTALVGEVVEIFHEERKRDSA